MKTKHILNGRIALKRWELILLICISFCAGVLGVNTYQQVIGSNPQQDPEIKLNADKNLLKYINFSGHIGNQQFCTTSDGWFITMSEELKDGWKPVYKHQNEINLTLRMAKEYKQLRKQQQAQEKWLVFRENGKTMLENTDTGEVFEVSDKPVYFVWRKVGADPLLP